MIELIAGEKGKGKTKMLMAKANHDIKVTGGSIIYLDINNKHFYELSNRIQLINIRNYNIRSTDMFMGFIYGILSQNCNVDRIFLDNFLAIACIDTLEAAEKLIRELSMISDNFDLDFVIAISSKKEDLSDYLQDFVTMAL